MELNRNKSIQKSTMLSIINLWSSVLKVWCSHYIPCSSMYQQLSRWWDHVLKSSDILASLSKQKYFLFHSLFNWGVWPSMTGNRDLLIIQVKEHSNNLLIKNIIEWPPYLRYETRVVTFHRTKLSQVVRDFSWRVKCKFSFICARILTFVYNVLKDFEFYFFVC